MPVPLTLPVPVYVLVPLLQAQLQAELAPYGIDTQVVDRYIVSAPQFSSLSTAAAAACCCSVVCLTSPRLHAA